MNISTKFTSLLKAKLTLPAILKNTFAGESNIIVHVAAVPERKEIAAFCESLSPNIVVVTESNQEYLNSLSLLMKSAFSGFVKEVLYVDEDYITKLMPGFDVSDLSKIIYDYLDDEEYVQAINTKSRCFIISFNKYKELEKRCI